MHDVEHVAAACFQNVPAFQYRRGMAIERRVRPVSVDVALGGAFSVYVEAAALGLEVVPENASRLTELGMEIRYAVQDLDDPLDHPEEPGLHDVYGTIITGAPRTGAGDGRNITMYAAGAADRSPCGTGVGEGGMRNHLLGQSEPDKADVPRVAAVFKASFAPRWLARSKRSCASSEAATSAS